MMEGQKTCNKCNQVFYRREGDGGRKVCLRCDPPKHAQVEAGKTTDFQLEALRIQEKKKLAEANARSSTRKTKNK